MSESINSQYSGPVVKKNRIHSIDTLRGVALFGILIMNIIGFALPIGSYYNPSVDANIEGLNLLAYQLMDIFFEGSMRTVFSMLFGAGVILFTSKPDTQSISVASLWFKRTILLIAFGLFDAYFLLWIGDILYVYGIAGLFLYGFRNSSPTKLLTYSAAILAVLALLGMGQQSELIQFRTEVLTIEALPADSEKTEQQLATLKSWQGLEEESFLLKEQNDANLAVRRAGYWDSVKGLVPINIYMQTVGLLTGALWDALAMMLLGMALMKWGVFNASRSYRFYGSMAFLGFGVGLPVNYYEVAMFVESGFEPYWAMNSIRPTYDIGRLGMALGYIGLVMLICKSGVFSWLRASLAAVGQMALTNYLSHTIICNFIFMGYGLGLVGQLSRFEIYYVVLGIWVLQLIISPIWLKNFRFGPVEWLWRSLTYMQLQPMSISASAAGDKSIALETQK